MFICICAILLYIREQIDKTNISLYFVFLVTVIALGKDAKINFLMPPNSTIKACKMAKGDHFSYLSLKTYTYTPKFTYYISPIPRYRLKYSSSSSKILIILNIILCNLCTFYMKTLIKVTVLACITYG